MSKETKICQNCKNQFTIEPEDFGFYEKIKVPPPTWCPECRFKRRLNTMNIYSLYKRNCDLCGKDMITIYHKDCSFRVYCPKCWWNDKWDGTEYAQDYDPNRSFFEQLIELRNKTPFMALENQETTLVNTEYTNYSSNIKNSYLTYFADYAEDCCYLSVVHTVKNSADCYRIRESGMCYGSIGISKCYKAFFSEECDNCLDVYFCKNCSGCSNCFGCINLRKKSYCIFNQQYTKDEYESFLKEAKLSSFTSVNSYSKKADTFWLSFPNKYYYGNSLNVNVSGNYVYESKNAKNSYMITNAEDAKYVQMLSVPSTKDSYDYTGWGDGAKLIYECQSVGMSVSNVRFSMHCYPNIMNCDYSYYANGCKNVFGCVNLKKKEYCIFNKQYSKEEYENLKNRIIADMAKNPYTDSMGKAWRYGEFFPNSISPFGYNETIAMDYFPCTKEQALSSGFAWREIEKNQYAPTIKSVDLPDNIEECGQKILDEIIECSNCKRSFKIVRSEFDLLKNLNLPVPRQCPECRRKTRFTRVSLPRLFSRKCQCSGKTSDNQIYQNTISHPHHQSNYCPNEFETSYASERKEIVYCEQCYQAEVV
ncbi:MAG: hypothetical protein AAB432_02590 [Patescibacteria group bacterium]